MKKLFNRVIKILIITDLVLLSGEGLILPVFAIFITDRIAGGNVAVAGYAAGVYWIVKSLVIIPLGRYLDKNHGEKDDLLFIVFGSAVGVIAILGYVFATLPWHIYGLQALFAIGMGMNIPGYNAIFTRHIDKGKEAFEWSVRSSLIGFGTGIAGALGGIIAYRFGFNILIVSVGIIMLISAFLPLLLLKEISARDKKISKIVPRKDGKIY